MQPSTHAALSHLPPSLQGRLAEIVAHPQFSASFSPAQIAELKDLAGLDDEALALALLPLAASYALTPLSQFNVGAIAHGISGHWYLGANMEFRHQQIQQTVHAEQSAITHAWHKDETRLTRITVNYSPCGHCRQFMNELNSGTELEIALPNQPLATLADYLPNPFGPQDLAISAPLLDHQPQLFHCSGSELEQAAIRTAAHSYAPYSQAHAGVVLQMNNGKRYYGRYTENAAFNPSLAPLQAALIMMHLAGEQLRELQTVVLAERAGADLSQYAALRAMLPQLDEQAIHRVVIA